MANEDSLPHFFSEESQFFDVLDHLLDQPDHHSWPDLKEPLPQLFSNNPSGYLTSVLDRYQEQPYLLDPHLERMVQPITFRLRHWLEYLQNHSAQFHASSADLVGTLSLEQLSERIQTISHLLYFLVKVRGYKTIVRFFPHQVSDLSIVISTFGLILPKTRDPSNKIVETFTNPDLWPFRYILLLWLSLICMIPFDLSRFNQLAVLRAQEIQSYDYIQNLGWSYLGCSGKEREAAALVLARLMLREDVFHLHLVPFLKKAIAHLEINGGHDVFLTTGIIQVLCILVDLARPAQLYEVLPFLHQAISNTNHLPHITSSITLRKLRTKLAGRVAVITPLNSPSGSGLEEDQVPESIETTVQDLLECLQDKDTVVRWTGAKYLARIGKRLPEWFSIQICDAILDLFSLKAIEEQEGKLDLLSVNDYTWQGACLACAEFLRQKSFPISRLEVLIKWGIRALHFEQRKGVQTIGSGVRDAAAYVFWSFGRAFSSAQMAPFAHQLAIELVLQSLFDREVHIRRAGSAAFQENVGRLGVFPRGIEVLQRMDFFTVGLGRSAFLKAAPEVARFKEYREAILDHLLSISVCHWDQGMRELGSQSICQIVRTTFDQIPPSLLLRLEPALKSKDVNKVHGAVLTLGELAKAIHLERSREGPDEVVEKIFGLIVSVLDSKLKSSQLEILLVAVCQALSYSLPTCPARCEAFIQGPDWMQLVDVGLKRSNNHLHCALQSVLHHLSLRGVGGEQITFFLKTLTTGLVAARQASGRCLGGFVFSSNALKGYFKPTFETLAACAESKPTDPTGSIEVIRNSLESLVAIVVNLSGDYISLCTQEQFLQLWKILLGGLSNYTSDQRGDVGSWVRASSLESVEKLVVWYLKSSVDTPGFPLALEHQFLVNSIFGGILRQSLDSIDSIRLLAWQTMSRILPLLSVPCPLQIDHHILNSLTATFDQKDSDHWRELEWTFPSCLKLLTTLVDLNLKCTPPAVAADQSSSAYLAQNSVALLNSLLEGIIVLIGGRGNSDSKQAGNRFADHVREMGKTEGKMIEWLVKGIMKLTKTGGRGTKNVGMCCWETVGLLLGADALGVLGRSEEGGKILHAILDLVTRALSKPKPITRVLAGAQIVVHLTGFKSVRIQAAHQLAMFLCHTSARVRALAAESLYNALQTQDDEAAEAAEIVSETDWSECSVEAASEKCRLVVRALEACWEMTG